MQTDIYPFPTGQKTRLNPLTIGFWWQWERPTDPRQTTRQATRVKIAFNRLGSARLAVGTPDPRQPANLRDDTERYVTLRHRASRVSYHVPKQSSAPLCSHPRLGSKDQRTLTKNDRKKEKKRSDSLFN